MNQIAQIKSRRGSSLGVLMELRALWDPRVGAVGVRRIPGVRCGAGRIPGRATWRRDGTATHRGSNPAEYDFRRLGAPDCPDHLRAGQITKADRNGQSPCHRKWSYTASVEALPSHRESRSGSATRLTPV